MLPTVADSKDHRATAEQLANAHDFKWLGVVASLIVPGVGLLMARRLAGLAWLAMVGTIAIVPLLFPIVTASGWFVNFSSFLLLICAVVSAEQARRALEPKPSWQPTDNVQMRGFVRPPRGRAVSLGYELEIPCSAELLWQRISRFEEFVCLDPFHRRVLLSARAPAAGVEFALEHAVMGIQVTRFGRILSWTAGQGYAFSDLSRRGGQRGFPHVFFVRIEPLEPELCQLVVSVRGHWTCPFVSPTIGTIWLRWVAMDHARILQRCL